MSEIDAMRLLSDANPVDAHDLAPLDPPHRMARRVPNRRLGVAIAVAAGVAAVTAGVFAFSRSESGPSHRHRFVLSVLHAGQGEGPVHRGFGGILRQGGPTGGGGPTPPTDPTTAYYADGPTGATGPTQTPAGTAEVTSLADARDALGVALVLPDVDPVDQSGIEKVVKDCGESPRDTGCDIGIGFPARRVWIYYQPAAQWSGSSDPLAVYRRSVNLDSDARIVYLSGTPALISNSGDDLQFLLDGVRIRIWVVAPIPSGGPTLEAIAQSIVDRSK